MSTDSEIGEIVARVRQRLLAVCENCGGEGYSDMGRSACAECYGAGVMTPELAERLRAGTPSSAPAKPDREAVKEAALKLRAQAEAAGLFDGSGNKAGGAS